MCTRYIIIMVGLLYVDLLVASLEKDWNGKTFFSIVAKLESDPFDPEVLAKTKQSLQLLESSMRLGERCSNENFQIIIRIHYALRSYEAATKVGAYLEKSDPEDIVSQEIRAKSYFYMGSYEQAFQIQERLINQQEMQEHFEYNTALLNKRRGILHLE